MYSNQVILLFGLFAYLRILATCRLIYYSSKHYFAPRYSYVLDCYYVLVCNANSIHAHLETVAHFGLTIVNELLAALYGCVSHALAIMRAKILALFNC